MTLTQYKAEIEQKLLGRGWNALDVFEAFNLFDVKANHEDGTPPDQFVECARFAARRY